jgi:TetR/AcrR family transcriptional regulator, cholesterol catabolism regulator
VLVLLPMSKIKTSTNKKDAIVAAAAKLFRRNGFKATSVRALAEELQIEAPSLYNHIGSKAELLSDICFGVAAEYTAVMQRLIQSKNNSVEKITSLIYFHINALYSNYDKGYVMDHDWKQLPKKELEKFIEIRRQYEQDFISIVEEGILKKEIKKIDATVTVLTILSAVRSIVFLKRRKADIDLSSLQKAITEQLLTGIIK